MKRLILAAVAASLLAVPVAQAAPRDHRPDSHHGQKYSGPSHKHQKKFDRRERDAPRWSHGKRVPDWRKKPAVRDYHRHGLKKPGRGQQWVKVGNDYLLIGIASGIIGGIIAGR